MAEKNRILSFNIDKYQMEFPQYVSHSGLQNTFIFCLCKIKVIPLCINLSIWKT